MPYTEHSPVVVALGRCLTRAVLPAFSIHMHGRPHSLRPLDAAPIVGYDHISYMTEIGLCGRNSNNLALVALSTHLRWVVLFLMCLFLLNREI
jgi:hydrogenase/urease accessory protein HupE